MGHVRCALARIAGDGMIGMVMAADFAGNAAASSNLAAQSVALIC
jgi:Pyruvate/2-oxoacid:ferredoxin oxidoreductase gamma subunit